MKKNRKLLDSGFVSDYFIRYQHSISVRYPDWTIFIPLEARAASLFRFHSLSTKSFDCIIMLPFANRTSLVLNRCLDFLPIQFISEELFKSFPISFGMNLFDASLMVPEFYWFNGCSIERLDSEKLIVK